MRASQNRIIISVKKIGSSQLYIYFLVSKRIRQLPINYMNGWDITPYMVRLGLPVVAMSGADSLNEQMLQAGATTAVRKDLLWSKLRDGTFTI